MRMQGGNLIFKEKLSEVSMLVCVVFSHTSCESG